MRGRLRSSARVRLSAALTAVFLLGGTALTGIAYVLVRRHLPTKFAEVISVPSGPGRTKVPLEAADVQGLLSPKAAAAEEAVRHAMAQADANAAHQILVFGASSLLALTALVALLGWWMTGRALRPVHAMIASQRRFAANASHELRTPLAVQRAAIQIGLDDPTPTELAEVRETLLAANTRTLRLIEGLLLLARSESEPHAWEQVRLAEIAAEEVARREDLAEQHDVKVSLRTEPADASQVVVQGDPVLLGHLVGNLVQNAIRYNRPGGTVELVVSADGAIRVENSGPAVDPDTVERLFEPFHRGQAVRASAREDQDGAGLGLSIVRAITQAHGGRIHASPGADGGLRVVVTLT